MKFVHTADWQLGAQLSHTGEQAPALRKKRFQTAETVVEVAEGEDAQFILIAGDLFEDHNVSDRIVHRAVRILNQFDPLPVYVLPGNHDPYRPGGVWDRDSWSAVGDHVHLLTEHEAVETSDEVVLLPCPIKQKTSTQDPTEAIPERSEDDGQVRVGLAHGGLSDAADQPNFPIDPHRAEKSGLDYLALGDWHGTLIRERTAYSGTIEQSAFGESDPGNVLVVAIDEAGAEPEVKRRQVGRLQWIKRDVEVADVSDVDALAEELDEAASSSQLVLRLNVRLLPSADDEVPARLDRLKHRLEDEAFFLDWQQDDAAFLTQQEVNLPEGLAKRADEILATVLDGEIPDGIGRTVADKNPETVRQARVLLRRMAREEQA